MKTIFLGLSSQTNAKGGTAVTEHDYLPPHLTKEQLGARIRLGHILYRHVDVGDMNLSDDAFIRGIWARYLASRETSFIDPAE
jgi:hypothetical protein